MAEVVSIWSLLDGLNAEDRAALDFFWAAQKTDLLQEMRAAMASEVRRARLYWKVKHRPRVELSYAEVRTMVERYERITAWELAGVAVKGRHVGLRDACEFLYRMEGEGLATICGRDEREGDVFRVKRVTRLQAVPPARSTS